MSLDTEQILEIEYLLGCYKLNNSLSSNRVEIFKFRPATWRDLSKPPGYLVETSERPI